MTNEMLAALLSEPFAGGWHVISHANQASQQGPALVEFSAFHEEVSTLSITGAVTPLPDGNAVVITVHNIQICRIFILRKAGR